MATSAAGDDDRPMLEPPPPAGGHQTNRQTSKTPLPTQKTKTNSRPPSSTQAPEISTNLNTSDTISRSLRPYLPHLDTNRQLKTSKNPSKKKSSSRHLLPTKPVAAASISNTANGSKRQLISSECKSNLDLPLPPSFATGSCDTSSRTTHLRAATDTLPAANPGQSWPRELVCDDREQPNHLQQPETAMAAPAENSNPTVNSTNLIAALIAAAIGTILLQMRRSSRRPLFCKHHKTLSPTGFQQIKPKPATRIIQPKYKTKKTQTHTGHKIQIQTGDPQSQSQTQSTQSDSKPKTKGANCVGYIPFPSKYPKHTSIY